MEFPKESRRTTDWLSARDEYYDSVVLYLRRRHAMFLATCVSTRAVNVSFRYSFENGLWIKNRLEKVCIRNSRQQQREYIGTALLADDCPWRKLIENCQDVRRSAARVIGR